MDTGQGQAVLVVTSDQPLPDHLEDLCFDLLYLATRDPDRQRLTLTIQYEGQQS